MAIAYFCAPAAPSRSGSGLGSGFVSSLVGETSVIGGDESCLTVLLAMSQKHTITSGRLPLVLCRVLG